MATKIDFCLFLLQLFAFLPFSKNDCHATARDAASSTASSGQNMVPINAS